MPLSSSGFFKFLIFVLKYFVFLFDGSLKYFPNVFFEILIKNFFSFPVKAGTIQFYCPIYLMGS